MGASVASSVSDELEAWSSVSDLLLTCQKMKLLTALPRNCHIAVIKKLWSNRHWVRPGEFLIAPGEINDRLIVILLGEAEAILHGRGCIPLLPAGSFCAEAALVCANDDKTGESSLSGEDVPQVYAPRVTSRGRARSGANAPAVLAEIEMRRSGKRVTYDLPLWVLQSGIRTSSGKLLPWWFHAMVVDCLEVPSPRGLTFPGTVRAVRRSLVTHLRRSELQMILTSLDFHLDSLSLAPVRYNVLQNIRAMGASARNLPLGQDDLMALRVVCEGPMLQVCHTSPMAPTSWSGPPAWIASCVGSSQPEHSTNSPVSPTQLVAPPRSIPSPDATDLALPSSAPFSL